MEESVGSRERRRYPRIATHLPLEFQEKDDSSLRGAMVVNAGKAGFLIESTRNMPVGTKLNVTLLFSNGFELAEFKAVAQIVRKELHRREDSEGNVRWDGYRYGLEFIQVSKEDRWKLNLLLGGRSEVKETFLSLFCQP